MKKFFMIFFSAFLLLSMVYTVGAENLYEGKCGENVTYIFNNQGVLNIKGTGIMKEYENAKDENIPWQNYRLQITTINIQNGVTSIGKSTFARCRNLTEVIIPDSVSNISALAFLSCESLPTITLPQNLSTISNSLFYACKSLSSIRLYNNIKTVEADAFGQCTSLKTVYFYGTPEEWNAIDINPEGNEAILNANIVYISEVLPTSISISAKPTYIIGEDTALDIAVTLNHNDGTTTTLSPNEYTLETDFDPNTEGEYNVKVTYGEFSDEVKVKVEPLKMVSLSTSLGTSYVPMKFVEGTELDLSNISIIGVYNNGKTEEITDYTVSGYDNNKLGVQTITISYKELSTNISIEIVRRSLSGIKIVSLPDKLYYTNDESEIDLTGLAIRSCFNNGTTEVCSSYTTTGFNPTKSGKQTITVSCEGFTDTFEVTVKRYDFKIDSNISKQYDFDTKTLTVGTHITNRTDAKAVKVLVAVYDSNGVLMGVKTENVFFDTNEVKDLSVAVENVEYPFDAIKVFVWDFDWEKMLPLAVVV